MKLNNIFKRQKKETHATSGVNGAYILHDKTRFETVESYKAARTNIMFSLPKSDSGKKIMITSSEPGEGKTTATINLAITFAQTGAKVIILDCDLRRPRTHRYLNLEKSEGMSNLLCGFSTLDQVIKKDIRPNLDCISVGAIPPNPAELLNSQEMEKILKELELEYDYIFIDTPPVTMVTDAVVLAKLCTGVILLVKQNETGIDMLSSSIESIKKSGTKILGFVVTGVTYNSKKYGYIKGKYSYKYGYRYKYGYGDDN